MIIYLCVKIRYAAYIPQLFFRIVANLNWFSTPFKRGNEYLREKSNNLWIIVDYAAMLPFGIQYLVFYNKRLI
jgi:hypothetical protein